MLHCVLALSFYANKVKEMEDIKLYRSHYIRKMKTVGDKCAKKVTNDVLAPNRWSFGLIKISLCSIFR